MIPLRKAQALEANPIFKQPAMIEPPKQSRDQAINAMEKQMLKNLPQLDPIKTEITPVVPMREADIKDTQGNSDVIAKIKPKSFEEMLKRAGIR